MKSLSIHDVLIDARYRWPSILKTLNITVPENNRHGPCPVCGGKDRFRFDDLKGRGTWFCSRCNAGDGLALVAKVFHCTQWEAAQQVGLILSTAVKEVAAEKPQEHNIIATIRKYLARCQLRQSPYLLNKGLNDVVQVLTDNSVIRLGDTEFGNGTAVFPLFNGSGEITGAQLIHTDGQKRLLSGSRMSGAFIIVRHEKGKTPERVIIAEGVATAMTIARFTEGSVFAAVSATNMVNVARELRKKYPESFFILAGDNDCGKESKENIGKLYAEKAAKAIGGIVAIPPTALKADWDDYRREYGEDAAKEAFLTCAESSAEHFHSPFPIGCCSIEKNKEQNFLIRNYLPEGALACIYGPSGSYKSFLAISMACHIATGKPWAGQKVKQGAVVYIVGEGGIGVPRRIKAWEKTYNEGVLARKLFRIDCPVYPADAHSLNQTLDALDEIRRFCQMPIRLIVIDTLARCFGGLDENLAKDMNGFIQGCDKLKAQTGATILIVHHSGKDQDKGARGSSALRAALDVEYRLTRESSPGQPQHSLVMRSTKLKEAEEPAEIAFDLKKVDIFVDSDNETVSSLVLLDSVKKPVKNECEYPELRGIPQLSSNHILLWTCIRELSDGGSICTKAAIRKALQDKGVDVSKNLGRCLDKLLRENLIRIEGEQIITLTRSLSEVDS